MLYIDIFMASVFEYNSGYTHSSYKLENIICSSISDHMQHIDKGLNTSPTHANMSSFQNMSCRQKIRDDVKEFGLTSNGAS